MRPAAPRELNDADLPSVSVLVVAHNEESVIRERIDNLLALDYPKDKLELVIASDSSRDRTVDIVNEYSGRGIQLIAFTERTGKSAVLDAVIPRLTGSIAVLSDANTMMEPSAVRRLVRWFQNPQVGVVCGKLVLTDPVTGTNVDSLYWRFETLLKRSEGRLGALLGANGGIYAIRRSVFQGLSHDTIVDDFVIPLLARVRTGCAIIYDESAIAYEETPPEIAVEFRRRARIGAGGFQSLAVLWPLLDPRNGWIALTFFSHKVLRWLCPFFLIGLVAANLVLVNKGILRRVAAGRSCARRRCAPWAVSLARVIGWACAAADDDVRDDERRAARGVFPLGFRASARARGIGRRAELMLYACLLLYITLIYIRPAEIVPEWATIPFVDILTGISACNRHLFHCREASEDCWTCRTTSCSWHSGRSSRFPASRCGLPACITRCSRSCRPCSCIS